MRKWRATGRVFDRFEYLIHLKTPHLDFGKWRLHQVEVLGCYCDHEGLCAQIDRAQRCGAFAPRQAGVRQLGVTRWAVIATLSAPPTRIVLISLRSRRYETSLCCPARGDTYDNPAVGSELQPQTFAEHLRHFELRRFGHLVGDIE